MRAITIKKSFVLFGAVALLFGFVGFGFMGHAQLNGCPLSAAMGPSCAKVTDHQGMLLQHLKSFKNLSASTPVDMMSLMSLGVVLVMSIFATRTQTSFLSFRASWYFRKRERIRHKMTSLFREMLFWSALHNKTGTIYQ